VSAEQERHIIAALAELRDTTVSEVMTPRVDVIGLPIPVHAGDVARAVRESGHSCFPVYDDDIDNLVGVLYVNDLFRAGWALDAGDDRPSPIDISRRLRQPYLVPETRRVLDVLGEMRNVRRTFAVVVDEYGGVAGIITVKDLLAALVGDLHDEFDPGGEPEVVRVDRKRWLVDGGTSIDDVRSQTGLALPEGKYVTLGGYIFDALGHIPIEGERLKYGDWELRVAEMDRRRIAKVLATQPSPGVADSRDAEGPAGSRNDAGSSAPAASSDDSGSSGTPGSAGSSGSSGTSESTRSVSSKDSDERSRAGA
jgi:CBS domain containing-hemolysin-like protein